MHSNVLKIKCFLLNLSIDFGMKWSPKSVNIYGAPLVPVPPTGWFWGTDSDKIVCLSDTCIVNANSQLQQRGGGICDKDFFLRNLSRPLVAYFCQFDKADMPNLPPSECDYSFYFRRRNNSQLCLIFNDNTFN